jgi:hypothetical protein
MQYSFNATVINNPVSGELTCNSATPSLVSVIRASDTDRNGTAIQSLWETVKAGDYIRLFSDVGVTSYSYYQITSINDNGTYHIMNVTWVDGTATQFADTAMIDVGPGWSGYSGLSGWSGEQGTAGPNLNNLFFYYNIYGSL